MNLYQIICGVFLFLPFSLTNILPSEQHVNISKANTLLPNIPKDSSKTLLIASEGGPLTNATVTLPKENNSMVINLDTSDLQKNITNSVVPRKGVKYVIEENNSIDQESLSSSDMITLDGKTNTTISPKTVTNKSELLNNEKPSVKLVHKPTVLSSQILDKLGENIDIQPDTKVKRMHENSHPDLVMPIVITILVVPMFAVVAYMALKRGQEAWKNRHYKRMDFLLDGMYNE